MFVKTGDASPIVIIKADDVDSKMKKDAKAALKKTLKEIEALEKTKADLLEKISKK